MKFKSGARLPPTWGDAPTEGLPVVWSGRAYRTCGSSVRRGSAGLPAPPPPGPPVAGRFCGWGKAGLTQSECEGRRRGLLARETGGRGWLLGGRDGAEVEGCDVARRRVCVTPASRRRLGVSATGLGTVARDAARGPGRGDLVWGR